ncbi:hypothetical protein AB6H03_24800 [Citrobacter portucalensis]|uniref:hypothetical protein n=1 Tax=Citrobacter portucalensis TaxID=1639133 RepID=UPI0034DCE317
MGEQITNAEWEKISPDNFETASLLRAVDAIDDLRGDFNDGEYSAPPQIRTDLLRLHEIAGEHEKPRGSHRMMPSTGVKITTIIS